MLEFKSLVDKIIGDAETNRNEVINKAKDESMKIVSKKIEEANCLKKSILEKAHTEGKELKERIISKSQLKVRNKKLEAKRKVLEEVFKSSLEELLNLDLVKFEKYILNIINSSELNGEYDLLVPNSYSSDADALLESINSKVNKNFSLIKVKPSDLIKGGFILEKDDVFINYSFEVLIDSVRDEIEFEVLNLLFN